MKIDHEKYDLHVLICTNEKEKGGGCGTLGGKVILEELKSWSKKAALKGKIRVNKSGCLGRCESGVACVAYPKGEWVIEANPADIPLLKEWIQKLNSES